MKQISIDGKQLSYPGTGLALVTAEFLRAFVELGWGPSIAVFVPPQVNPAAYHLEHGDLRWLPVETRTSPLQNWCARAATIPDYLERRAWAKAVITQQKKLEFNAQHFIPYLYNYGNLQQNVVLVPDLIYRLVSEEIIDRTRPWWWNLRHQLQLRARFRAWEETQVFQAKHLVVYSEFVREFVAEAAGIKRDRMTLIPLAAPTWIEAEYRRDRENEIRAKYRLPDRFVLYVGGYSNRKNIPLLLRVCGEIARRDPNFCCVFAGLTEELLQTIFGVSLRAELENPQVKAAILPLPSPSNRDLATLYRLAEFTVYPSLSEGFGLPILEAAAAGKLCLCGDNSSLKELQPNPQYRIASEDEEKWRDRILDYWQNPQKTEQAGRDCAKLINNYSWKKSAEQLWELLQSGQ